MTCFQVPGLTKNIITMKNLLILSRRPTLLISLWVIGIGGLAAQPMTPWVVKQGERFVRKTGASALAIGIVSPEDTVVLTWGTQHPQGEGVLTPQSVFPLGELSQVFTTALMTDAYFSGELDLYQPVQAYLPAYFRMPAYQQLACEWEWVDRERLAEKEGNPPVALGLSCTTPEDSPRVCVSFCHLASHHAGLGSFPPAGARRYPLEDMPVAGMEGQALGEAQFVETVNQQVLPAPSGTVFRYSNLGIALIGHALSHHLGQPYEDLLMERICRPLALDQTYPSLLEVPDARFVYGKGQGGGAIGPYNPESMVPALGLSSAPEDLLRLMQAMMDESAGGALFAAFDECQVPHKPVKLKKLGNVWAGYGWMLDHRKKNDTWSAWQVSNQAGYHHFAGMTKAQGVGVFVLSSGGEPVYELGQSILSALEKRAPTPDAPTDLSKDL